MISKLTPSHYTSDTVFKQEVAVIHRKLWLFAGFRFSVAKPQQFFTRELAGVPVVVQNNDGEVCAFVNSCAHRLTKIHGDDFGSGPMKCPYHGWNYAADGAVATIPFEHECYKFTAPERAGLGLRKVHLATIGEFIFVNLDETPIDINEQFDAAVQRSLTELSPHLDHEFIFSKKTGIYNWKLAIENLNDELHPHFVHPKSFAENKYVRRETGEQSSRAAKLSHLSYSEKTPVTEEMRRLPYYDNVQRFGAFHGYYNWLLYPSLHMTSFNGGHTFVVEHYNPVAAAETELVQFVLTAKKKQDYPDAAAVLWHTLKGTKVILDEDQRILEQTQAGMSALSPAIQLGDYETKNKNMEAWYLKQLGERQ